MIEPTELGAMVIDAHGVHWMRVRSEGLVMPWAAYSAWEDLTLPHPLTAPVRDPRVPHESGMRDPRVPHWSSEQGFHDIDAGGSCRARGCTYFTDTDGESLHTDENGEPL